MSKYDALWRYIQSDGSERLVLTFDEVGKISMKAQEVVFVRTECR